MPFFQKAFSNIGQKVSEHFEKKRQEQEEFDTMRRQADFQEKIERDQREKKQAIESARTIARERINKEKGIKKLMAINRLQMMEQNPDSLSSRLSQHTLKNIKRTEDNKRRSMELKEQARKMREEEMERRQAERRERIARRRI